MQLDHFDHIVVTTRDLQQCLAFYVDMLGMRHVVSDNHHAVSFGQCKINIHQGKAEFLPAADDPAFGSSDFCLIAQGNIQDIFDDLKQKNAPFVLPDIVERNGALGLMDSVYLRDPDGNLVEISVYRATALSGTGE